MTTQLKDLATVGIKPILLMLAETVFLAVPMLACCGGGIDASRRKTLRLSFRNVGQRR